jgi:hypothetical protein
MALCRARFQSLFLSGISVTVGLHDCGISRSGCDGTRYIGPGPPALPFVGIAKATDPPDSAHTRGSGTPATGGSPTSPTHSV